MQLLPLISYSPFLLVKFFRLSEKHKAILIIGFLIGLFPLFLNLIFSFNKYGFESLIYLFRFSSDKAFSDSDISGLFFYPLNLILLSLPSTVFLIRGLITVFKEFNIEEKLLLICAPLIAIILLMISSSNHNHYLLFIIPWTTILSSIGLEEILIKNKLNILSKKIFVIILALISILLISSNFFIDQLPNITSSNNNFYKSFSSLFGISFLILSIFIFNNLFKREFFTLTLISLINLSICLNLFFLIGIINNTNKDFKIFLNQPSVKSVISNNEIFLIGTKENDKLNLLLKFYLPRYNYDLENLYKSNLDTKKHFYLKNNFIFINKKYLDQIYFNNFNLTNSIDMKDYVLTKIN